MNLDTFKSHLYNKDTDLIKSIDLDDDLINNSAEFFILANFFQNYLNGVKYLSENFTQNFWKWISSDINNFKKISNPSESDSLYNVFPKCKNYESIGDDPREQIKRLGGTQYYVCDRKHLTKSDNIYRTIKQKLKMITREQKIWSKKNKVSQSWIMRDPTINYICENKPLTENELQSKYFYFKNTKNLKRDGARVLKVVRDSKNNYKENFGCSCGVTDIKNNQKNYTNFHFYEWLSHWDIKKENFFSRKASDLVAYKLAGYIARIQQIASHLQCEFCNSLLVPNWNYAKNIGASYNVTIFHCINADCNLKRKSKNIYINHCLNAYYCECLIDSRVNKKRCKRDRIYCNSLSPINEGSRSDNCQSCCQECLDERIEKSKEKNF